MFKVLIVMIFIISCVCKEHWKGINTKFLPPRDVVLIQDIKDMKSLELFLENRDININSISDWEDNEGRNWFMCFLVYAQNISVDEICSILKYFVVNLDEDLWNRDTYGSDFLHYLTLLAASLGEPGSEEKVFNTLKNLLEDNFCSRENDFGITQLFIAENLEMVCFRSELEEVCKESEILYKEHQKQIKEFTEKCAKVQEKGEDSYINWEKRESFIMLAKLLLKGKNFIPSKVLYKQALLLHPNLQEILLNIAERIKENFNCQEQLNIVEILKNKRLPDNKEDAFESITNEANHDCLTDTKLINFIDDRSEPKNEEVVEVLLKAGADKDKAMTDGWTPLYVASMLGKVEVVEELLKAGANKDKAFTDGATPLHIASQNGHKEVVEVLLKAGADKDKADNDRRTSLYIASQNGHKEVVEELLKAGADKDKAFTDGATLLHIASQNGHEEVVELLLKAGADKDKADKDGRTPLWIASYNGHKEVVEVLLEEGADKDKAMTDGATPMYIASQAGKVEVVEILLKAGADKDKDNNNEVTPLYIASYNGHKEVVELLLKAGADKDKADKDVRTPLWIASYNGHKEVVELLLKEGADKDRVDKDGRTLLYIASQAGKVEVVELLLKAGTDKDKGNNNEATPLYIASQAGKVEVVELLLKEEADKDKARTDGATPLWIASYNGHKEVVEILLKAGADKDKGNNNEATPLYIASYNGHTEVVEELLKAGADKDKAKNNGATPLNIASQAGKVEVVELLLKAGADKDKADNDGRTPLYIASQEAKIEVVEILLKAGAKVDISNISIINRGGKALIHWLVELEMYNKIYELKLSREDINTLSRSGKNVLHYAVACNAGVASVKMLLDAGCELGIKDKYGSLPIDIAIKKGNVALFGFLYEIMKRDKNIEHLINEVESRAEKGRNKSIKEFLLKINKDAEGLSDIAKRKQAEIEDMSTDMHMMYKKPRNDYPGKRLRDVQHLESDEAPDTDSPRSLKRSRPSSSADVRSSQPYEEDTKEHIIKVE